MSNPLTDAWDTKKCLVGAKTPVAMLIFDNCTSDGFGPSGHVAFLVLGTIWLHVGSDVLICMSYATKQSYRNPVELLFGWVSWRLAGNVINADPLQALKDVDTLESGERDGYKVVCDILPEGPDPAWGEYDTYPRFTPASNKQVRGGAKLKDLYETYIFLIDHCGRRANFLAFIRCGNKKCKCSQRSWKASKFRADMDLLKGLPSLLTMPIISCRSPNTRKWGSMWHPTPTSPHLVVM